MAFLKSDQVIFYHPLDNFDEYTQSQSWDGLGNFMSGLLPHSYPAGLGVELGDTFVAYSAESFCNTSAYRNVPIRLSNTKHMVIYNQDEGGSKNLYGQIISYENDIVTSGEPTLLTAGTYNTTSYPNAFNGHALTEDQCLLVYGFSSPNQLRGMVVDISGLTITPNNYSIIYSNFGRELSLAEMIPYQSGVSSGIFMLTSRRFSDQKSYATPILVSGTTIDSGNSITPNDDANTNYLAVASFDAENFVMFYNASGHADYVTPNLGIGMARHGSLSGATCSWEEDAVEINTWSVPGTDNQYYARTIAKQLCSGQAVSIGQFKTGTSTLSTKGILATLDNGVMTITPSGGIELADPGEADRIAMDVLDDNHFVTALRENLDENLIDIVTITVSGTSGTKSPHYYSGELDAEYLWLSKFSFNNFALYWNNPEISNGRLQIFDVSGISNIYASNPDVYPSASGFPRLTIALWCNQPTSFTGDVHIDAGYAIRLTSGSIIFGDNGSVWNDSEIADFMSQINDGSNHFMVLDFANSGSNNWGLSTSTDGSGWIDHGIQNSGTTQLLIDDGNSPRIGISGLNNEETFIDELIVWGGSSGDMPKFTDEQLSNLYNLAYIKHNTMPNYSNYYTLDADDEINLFIGGSNPTIQLSGNMFINGCSENTAICNLFLNGYDDLDASGNLYIHSHENVNSDVDLFIRGISQNTISINLFVDGHVNNSGSCDLFVDGYLTVSFSGNLFVVGDINSSGHCDLSVYGRNNVNDYLNLYTHGHVDSINSSDMFIGGYLIDNVSGDLFTYGKSNQIISGSLYIVGDIAENSSIDLFVYGQNNIVESGDLYIHSYDLMSDATSLYTVSIDDRALYWADDVNGKIQRSLLDGTNIKDVLINLPLIQSLVIDRQDNSIYFGDSIIDKIEKCDPNGANRENVVTDGLAGIRGIAISQSLRKIYWTDTELNVLKRCDIDGSNIETLVSLGVSSIVQKITIDDNGGKIYWTDENLSGPTIKRANLDGTNVQTIINTNITQPREISVDTLNSKIYWVDAIRDSVDCADLDGSNRENIATINGPQSIAIDTYDQKLYVGDLIGKIYRLNTDGSDKTEIVNTSGVIRAIDFGIVVHTDGVHVPSPNDCDIFIYGYQLDNDQHDLILIGHEDVDTSCDLWISGPVAVTTYDNLFIQGNEYSETSCDLLVNGFMDYSMSGDLFINGHTEHIDTIDLVIHGHTDTVLSCDLLISGKTTQNESCDIFVSGFDEIVTSGDLFVGGVTSYNNNTDLFVLGDSDSYNSVNLYAYGYVSTHDLSNMFIGGHSTDNDQIYLFTNGYSTISFSGNLFTASHSSYNDNLNLFIHGDNNKNNFINLYICGHIDVYDSLNLFINGNSTDNNQTDLFMHGYSGVADYSNLFIRGDDDRTKSIDLFIEGSTASTSTIDFSLERLLRTSDHSPQLIGNFTTSPSGVNIEVWDITNGQNLALALESSGCYPIGNTGRWGWSTQYLPTLSGFRELFYYRMTSNLGEIFEGQLILGVPESTKWFHPKDSGNYLV